MGASLPIGRTNSEDEFPLLEEGSVSSAKRVAGVVNTGRFGGRPIQLQNFEVLPGLEIGGIAISDIVATDEKALYAD